MIAFATLGYFLFRLFKRVRELYKGQQSKSWPAVPCVIQYACVESKDVLSGKKWQTIYYPHIRYRYVVTGPELEGASVNFTPSFMSGDKDEAYKICEKYRVDSRHDVYYNPKNPAEAVLQPGIHIAFVPLFSLLFEIIIVGVVVWTFLQVAPGPLSSGFLGR